MAQEPKKKHSKARKRVRRSSISLAAINLIVCKNCGEKTLSHMTCKNCGFYAGKKVGLEQVKVTKA